jgi:Trk K+ transport system NAD-binding subunit
VETAYDVAAPPDAQAARRSGHAIVVGGDWVALRVCARLAAYETDGCVLLGCRPEDARDVLATGVTRLVEGDPTLAETLVAAKIASARSLLLLSEDDRLNLHVALRARDLNPGIRIVMRQFNRALGRKLEAKLENATVLSLASQSAAIFASATIDAANYYGIQFPDIDGPLFGFARRAARDLDVVSERVDGLEARLNCRVLSVDGRPAAPSDTVSRDSELVTFGRVVARAGPPRRRKRPRPSARRAISAIAGGWRRADPLARRLTITAVLFYVIATVYFVGTLHVDPFTSAYFVLTTMTTTGYGDIVPHATDHFEQLASMITMLGGVVITGLFVALVAANFTQARYRAQQGLRPIDAVGHIVVCGAGRVGSRAIDFLIALGRHVVVIERSPSPAIVERAREREFALLTGDATADKTLGYCNLAEADAVVALTESDTMNLEVVLGAQAINPQLHVVMRVLEDDFARSIAKHFHLHCTFGAADIVSPVLAGLSMSPNVRGLVDIAGRDYGISDIAATSEELAELAKTEGVVPLATWHAGREQLVNELTIGEEGTRLLFLYPAYRHHRALPGR